jgi:hypothetical protein
VWFLSSAVVATPGAFWFAECVWGDAFNARDYASIAVHYHYPMKKSSVAIRYQHQTHTALHNGCMPGPRLFAEVALRMSYSGLGLMDKYEEGVKIRLIDRDNRKCTG